MKAPSKITIPVKITNGKFSSNLPLVKSVLTANEGMTVDVTISKRKNKRSNDQNAYYWGVVVPIIQNCILDQWGEIVGIEYVHEFLKNNCNYIEVANEDTGEVLRRVKSTTENTTITQEDFHSKCRKLASDFFNTEIPLPNEEITLKF